MKLTKEIKMTIGNVCNAKLYDALIKMKVTGEIVTPEYLDNHVEWMAAALADKNLKYPNGLLREHAVDFILREFDVTAFGVDNAKR